MVSKLSVDELRDRFVSIALRQEQALLEDDYRTFRRLYREMDEVREELRNRGGDQRSVLTTLFDHPNAQVRLKAAKSTLAVAPEAARRVIRAIAESREQPQAGEAGMSLYALEKGIFRPS